MMKSLLSSWKEYKRVFIGLFLLSLIPRLILLGAFIHRGVYDSWKFDYGDGIYYTQVAKNILFHHTISIDLNNPPAPDSLRTPLYSIALIPFIYAHAPLWVPALLQDIFVSLFTILFFLMLVRLFHYRIALFAGILIAIEPYWIFLSNRILAEPLFIPLFISGFLGCLYFLKYPRPKYLYISAICFALAALTRPVALYFFVGIPLLVFYHWYRHRRENKIWLHLLGVSTLFLCILAPWFIRNRITLHSWSISSVQEYNLFEFNGKPFCEWLGSKCDRDFIEATHTLPATFNQEYAAQYKKAGATLILNHKLAYARFAIRAIPHLFFDNAYVDIIQIFYDKPLYTTSGLTQALLRVDFGKVRDYFWQTNFFVLSVILLGKLFFILFFLIAVSSIFLLLHKRCQSKEAIAFLVLSIGLYAILSSPIGSPRLRSPIFPLMVILVGFRLIGHNQRS